MEDKNIILAGVGGQGILSIAYGICMAALKQQMNIKQAEVHGMAQRGGAVQSHLRIARGPVASDLIPRGRADMVLAVEPLEALRYVHYLSPSGTIIANTAPVVNIAEYPDVDGVLQKISSIGPHRLIEAEALARKAGNLRAQNMVMLGAAADVLGLAFDDLTQIVSESFARKGQRVVEANVKALEYGRRAGRVYQECVDKGMSPTDARAKATDLPEDALR
jgi:indolepyruvate ferredoxin oxidoreductase beta subunit